MKIRNVEFLTSAVKKEQYPNNLPQIAFVGRSNVGKSSMINTLLNRKNMARVSQTPGKTRTINFFEINKEFVFVDLPGYGYAKLSKKETANWGKIMEEYFQHSKELQHIFILVDIRHSPKKDDLHMVDYVKYNNIPVSIIATKADKLNRNDQNKAIKNISETLMVDKKNIFILSSLKKYGQDEIWKHIENIFLENDIEIKAD